MEQNRQLNIKPTCPVCGKVASTLLCTVDGFDIWRCEHSLTEFVWPMPDTKYLYTILDGKTKNSGEYSTTPAATTVRIADLLTELEQKSNIQSILEIGCGEGQNLEIAYERGWKCFGVEASEKARDILKQRYGNKFYVSAGIEDMICHEFDVILMLDVISHICDPYALFFTLFTKGAITPNTKVIITTPNAGSYEGLTSPKEWVHRHLPDNLVYYSEKSLDFLLKRLHFANTRFVGLCPLSTQSEVGYDGEDSKIYEKLENFSGILCQADGSDFMAFMHERYVPGTWSKIAEYEHLPRYRFASKLADGGRVLDFGCGTGYGAALLAEVAQKVTGIDIDEAALHWATEVHRNPRLGFERRSDLAKGMQSRSFDLITCFEMIEHVAEDMQIELISNFANLLAPGGKLLISTPNPEITAKYGENPFHIREMTEQQFRQLLGIHFKHIVIIRQWISPAVVLAPQLPLTETADKTILFEGGTITSLAPLAYIAVCSQEPIADLRPVSFYDLAFDYIAETLRVANKLNRFGFEHYTLQEEAANKDRQIAGQNQQIAGQIAAIQAKDRQLAELVQTIRVKDQQLADQTQTIQAKDRQLVEHSQAIQAKDRQIGGMWQAIDERDQLINAVLSSKSWKVTKPLRWVARVLGKILHKT